MYTPEQFRKAVRLIAANSLAFERSPEKRK
jgi:hypothetical protein